MRPAHAHAWLKMIAEQPRAAAETEAEIRIEIARWTETDVTFEDHETGWKLESLRLGVGGPQLLGLIDDHGERRGELAAAIFVARALEKHGANLRRHALSLQVDALQLDSIVGFGLALHADRPAIELVTHAHAQAFFDRSRIEPFRCEVEPGRSWCDRQPRGNREREAGHAPVCHASAEMTRGFESWNWLDEPGPRVMHETSKSLFRNSWVALALVSGLAGGCKDEEMEVAGELGDACEPADEDPCATGLVCEPQGDAYICAGPVEIHGMVVDALDLAPVAGARVLALDATGAPVSNVAISDADGNYVLPIAVPRDPDGNPDTASTFTLSATALDYQIYPSGLQPAFPVSTADVMEAEDDPDVDEDDNLSIIENASTTIGLLPLDNPSGFTVSGRVGTDADETGGTLVVAEGTYTIADRSGEFALFNVATGDNTIMGYRGGLQIVPEMVNVSANVEGVVLELSADGTATVNGSVNIVNPGDGGDTSVVMIPSSLFSDVFEFGPVPFGLRAPEPGVAPNVGGAFTIAGVPAGTYKIIAALENDFLVRDPDTGIAGTEILEITVAAGDVIDLQDSFKVTGALGVISPGRDGPEEVTGTPTFQWEDDSSEDYYELVVHDALGNEIWLEPMVPGVSGGGEVTAEYGGPALTPGMYYRFRATSWKDGSPISRTEDLRGVFVYGG
jgi:hypothetical protein